MWLLFSGYTPLFSGTVGLALTAIVVVGAPLAGAIGPYGLRILFWVLIGLAASAFLRFGITAILALVAVLIAGA